MNYRNGSHKHPRVKQWSPSPPASTGEMNWQGGFDFSETPEQEPAPKEPEDLSWLHDLEEQSKKTGELSKPQPDFGWMENAEITIEFFGRLLMQLLQMI